MINFDNQLRMLYLTALQFLTLPVAFVYFDLSWLLLLLVSYFILNVFGFSISFHHTFAHKNFTFYRPVELMLMYIGTCATLVSPIAWAYTHNTHHRFTDTEKDPHSPKYLGWNIIFYFYHVNKHGSLVSIKHLLKDKIHRWLNATAGFWLVVLSFPLTIFIIGGFEALLHIWAIPTCMVLWTGIIFVSAHNDESDSNKASNSWLLNLVSIGDGNHKKHHSNWTYVGELHKICASIIGGRYG
jgi:stearoyl-CoA desaturase (delta-9 desaturase)